VDGPTDPALPIDPLDLFEKRIRRNPGGRDVRAKSYSDVCQAAGSRINIWREMGPSAPPRGFGKAPRASKGGFQNSNAGRAFAGCFQGKTPGWGKNGYSFPQMKPEVSHPAGIKKIVRPRPKGFGKPRSAWEDPNGNYGVSAEIGRPQNMGTNSRQFRLVQPPFAPRPDDGDAALPRSAP